MDDANAQKFWEGALLHRNPMGKVSILKEKPMHSTESKVILPAMSLI